RNGEAHVGRCASPQAMAGMLPQTSHVWQGCTRSLHVSLRRRVHLETSLGPSSTGSARQAMHVSLPLSASTTAARVLVFLCHRRESLPAAIVPIGRASTELTPKLGAPPRRQGA